MLITFSSIKKNKDKDKEKEDIEGQNDYSFKAVYLTEEDNQKVQLINNVNEKNIKAIEVDGKKIEITKEYTFPKSGEHKVNVFLTKIENTNRMFLGINKLISISFPAPFDTSRVTDMSQMFSGCSSLKSIDVSSFDTSNVETMSEMFSGCDNLESLDLSNFKTDNVKDMSNMFALCISLKTLNVNSFNTKNVVYMNDMFSGCNSLDALDLSSFNTENVKYMNRMFFYNHLLEYIKMSAKFNTKKVEDMGSMFEGCSSLKTIDLSSFNTENVKDITYMFSKCKALSSIELSNFDTKKVVHMDGMFYDCPKLVKIDIFSFESSSQETISLFKNLPEEGIIKIKEDFQDLIKEGEIPENWTVEH